MLTKKYSIIILYFATILGMGFSFVGSILNSKMLSRELFGDFKYIQNYLLLISSLVSFGIFQAGGRLIAATENRTKTGIIKGYLLYACAAGLLIMFMITLALKLFGNRILNDNIFHYLLIFFPLFIINPLTYYFEAVFQAERKILNMSIYRLLPATLYISCLYFFRKYSSGSISFNILLYYSSSFIVFIFFLLGGGLQFKGNTLELKELSDENKKFGIHIYYGSLWSIGTGYILTLLIGFFNVNNVDVGTYSLAINANMILTFLPAIFGTAYFRDFMNAPKIPSGPLKMAIISSLVLLVFILFTIDTWIRLFLNEHFLVVGRLVKIGATSAVLHGFADLINKFLIAKGKGSFIKKVAITVGIIQLISSLILIPHFSATGAMISKTIGSATYFFILLIFYLKNYGIKNI